MLSKGDLDQIRKAVSTEVNAQLKSEFKPVKTDIAKIRGDVSTIVNFFDREVLDLRQRVERIEEVLTIKKRE